MSTLTLSLLCHSMQYINLTYIHQVNILVFVSKMKEITLSVEWLQFDLTFFLMLFATLRLKLTSKGGLAHVCFTSLLVLLADYQLLMTQTN